MPWFAFPESVLSKPIVWLGDYAFISKNDSRLFEQRPGMLFPNRSVLSLRRLCCWETLLSIQKVTADCVAVQFLNNQ